MKFLIIFLFSVIYTKYKLLNVTLIDQTKYFPTGCESISTMMCIDYWKKDLLTPYEFIDNYVDQGKFYYKNGQLFAPHPSDKFVGSPYDDNSYGCYEPVIERALNKLIQEKNLDLITKNLTDIPMEKIISDYIDKDIPVIFWATMYMLPYLNGSIWIVPETGEKFQWRAREHCLLLVGYDFDDEKQEYYYIFNDPMKADSVQKYEKAIVEQRHKDQYSMAVALMKKSDNYK